MGQDATKVLLGSTLSSDKPGSNVYDSDPATYLAGLACRLASTGLLSLSKSAGEWVGISLGRSLSDIKKTSVLRAGKQIPIRLALKKASGTITVSSYANLVSGTPDTVTIGSTAFTAQSSAVTAGQATFQAATSNTATAQSLADQINAHATAGALVRAQAASGVVTLHAIAEGSAGNGAIAVTYTDNDTNVGITLSGLSGGKLSGGSDLYSDISYATLGSHSYIDDATGKANENFYGSTVSNAVYASDSVLNGIDEDGNSVPCALVDMIGGL